MRLLRAARRGAVAMVVSLTALMSAALPQARQSAEEQARRQYQTGVDFLRQANFVEALRDFQAVVDAYPESSVADNALLQIARYQLETGRLDSAQSAIDLLHKKYPTSDASPAGYVVAGRLALARGRQPAEIEHALANFERVPRLFPGTSAVPEAMLARADTLRAVGRCGDALDQYGQLTVQYPRSTWAPEANIGASKCLVAQGRVIDAMATLQLAVSHDLAGPRGAAARDLNTTLYRLYMRSPQPAFAFVDAALAAAPGRIRDLVAVAANSGRLLAVTESGATILDLAKAGTVMRTSKFENVRGVFTDASGQPAFYSSTAILRDGERPLPLSVVKPDKSTRNLEDISAIVAMATGELIVADGNGPALHRFNKELKAATAFASTRAHRLAIGSFDQVVGLDRDDKTITLWTRDGKPTSAVSQRGPGWQFGEPIDIVLDPFDHLYVLDRGLGTVFVFVTTPSPKYLTSFSLPERVPGAFRRATSFALGPDGRLYIHDNRAERLQVYQ